uniref:chondroadherin-like isoform X1 n=2 Tax=Pristiophorus japonicus TaxID=55135 RepID=UPI00398ED10E
MNMALFGMLLCSATLALCRALTVGPTAPSADAPCPGGCTCHANTWHVGCTNVSLSGVPGELPRLTTELKLSAGSLPAIPANAFLGLPALTTLHLSGNGVSRVGPGAFNGLSRLQFLHLDNNGIEALEVGVFDNVSALTFLHLENNLIANITPGVFSNLRKLNALYLNNNRLTVLVDGTFKGLSALRWLFLSNNGITAIASKAFTGNRALKKLYLDGNKLTAVPSSAARSIRRLDVLQLSNNNISRLTAATFGQKLRYLTKLYLDDTSLDAAPPEAFSRFRRLEVLSLKDNRLATLSASRSFWFIKHFGLSGNAWRCDCGLIWLRDWLLKQSATDQSEVICSSPRAQAGKLLLNVQLQDLTCPPDNLDVSAAPSITAKNHSSTPRRPPSSRATAQAAPPNASGNRPTPGANTGVKQALPATPDPCLSKRIQEVTASEVSASSLLVNWSVREDLGDEYEVWYSTGADAQSLRVIGGVQEVELSQLWAGSLYTVCVVPQSSNINRCLRPTANQCTEAHTLGLPGNTEPVQSGDRKGQYALGVGIAVTMVLLVIAALIVAVKLRSRRTGFQRHYDEDMSAYVEHFEIDQSKMDFDQVNRAYENIIDEGNMYFHHIDQGSKVEAESALDGCSSTARYRPLTNNLL